MRNRFDPEFAPSEIEPELDGRWKRFDAELADQEGREESGYGFEAEPFEAYSEFDHENDEFDAELANAEWETNGGSGARSRSSSSITAPNLQALRNNIVKLANQEWTRWGRGAIKEWEPRIRSVLQNYWRIGTRRTLTDGGWWSKHPWSAAFISWVMRNAGAGNAFRYSSGHAVYIKDAKDNRLANNNNPFKAYRTREVRPQPGDLVCKSRAGSGATYDNIRSGLTTHCDFVTEVRPNQLITIGGNVNNSVSKTVVPTDANGYVNRPGYFAVIRIGAPSASTSAARSATSTGSSAGSSGSASTRPSPSGRVVIVPFRRRPSHPDSLEDGVAVRTMARFRPTGHPRDVILAATGAAEGGYDTVNMYDRGILSWGIMQWTVHAGSLQNALAFIKSRLAQRNQAALWAQLFPDLDVQRIRGSNQLTYRGAPVIGQTQLRLLFRGAAERGRFVDATIRRWAEIFARAGRHPVMQEFQREYARQEIDRALNSDYLPRRYGTRYRRVNDYVGRDLKASTLFFGMWTNNRVQTYLHLKRSIDAIAARHGTHELARWPAGWQATLTAEFERVLRASRFGYWGDAKARAAGRTSRTQKILAEFHKLTRQR